MAVVDAAQRTMVVSWDRYGAMRLLHFAAALAASSLTFKRQ
jgi:hypothetical protein